MPSKLIWRVLFPALLLRLLLLVVGRFVESRAFLSACRGMPLCEYFSRIFSAFKDCRGRVSTCVCAGRHRQLNMRRRLKRIQKLAMWAIILFGVLYWTMLCDAC